MVQQNRTRLLLETWQREPAKNSVEGKPYEERESLSQIASEKIGQEYVGVNVTVKPSIDTVNELLIPHRASWLESRIEQFVPSLVGKYNSKQLRRIQRVKNASMYKAKLGNKKRRSNRHSNRQAKRNFAQTELMETMKL